MKSAAFQKLVRNILSFLSLYLNEDSCMASKLLALNKRIQQRCNRMKPGGLLDMIFNF